MTGRGVEDLRDDGMAAGLGDRAGGRVAAMLGLPEPLDLQRLFDLAGRGARRAPGSGTHGALGRRDARSLPTPPPRHGRRAAGDRRASGCSGRRARSTPSRTCRRSSRRRASPDRGAFCERLLAEAHVAAVPGDAFGVRRLRALLVRDGDRARRGRHASPRGVGRLGVDGRCAETRRDRPRRPPDWRDRIRRRARRRALCGEQGWSVRALARSDPSRSPLARRGARSRSCRATSRAPTVSRRRPGTAHAIVHVAGLLKARTLEDYREVNVRGEPSVSSRRPRETAPDAMFVHVSTQAAAGPARGGTPVAPSDPPRPVSWYGRRSSKARRRAAAGWRGPWVVLRPGVVYGAGRPRAPHVLPHGGVGARPGPRGGRRIQMSRGARVHRAAIASAARRPDLVRPDGVSLRSRPRDDRTPGGARSRELPRRRGAPLSRSRTSRSGWRASPRRPAGGDHAPLAPVQRRQGAGTSCRRMALRVGTCVDGARSAGPPSLSKRAFGPPGTGTGGRGG